MHSTQSNQQKENSFSIVVIGVIYNSACDPLLILFVDVIKINYALLNITVAEV
jgi:hypothetical protein